LNQEKLPDIPEEKPSEEERPKKIPRVLPVSREEYYARRRRIDNDGQYIPSTFSVKLEEKQEKKEEKKENLPPPVKKTIKVDNPVTIFDFLTMIPVILTAVSLLWHMTWEEVHPLLHSIIDFGLILYHSLWILFFIVGDKLEDTETMLSVTSIILEIAMLGKYGDMSHAYLQCMFSVPLMLVLLIIFLVLGENTGKRGKFAIVFGESLWLSVVMFPLWRGVHHFRWIGLCQLIGVFLTSLSLMLSKKALMKKNFIFMILSGAGILAVILGLGA